MGDSAESGFRRFLTAPPGWPLFALTALPCVIALWACSFPTSSYVTLLLGAMFPLALLGLCWIIRFAVAMYRGNRAWRSVAAPVMVVTTAAAIVTGVPLQLRMQYAKEDFAALVRERETHSDQRWASRKVGSYNVSGVRRHGQNWYFVIADSGFLNDDGLAYLPDGPPPRPDSIGESVRVGHIRGPWYWFSASW